MAPTIVVVAPTIVVVAPTIVVVAPTIVAVAPRILAFAAACNPAHLPVELAQREPAARRTREEGIRTEHECLRVLANRSRSAYPDVVIIEPGANGAAAINTARPAPGPELCSAPRQNSRIRAE